MKTTLYILLTIILIIVGFWAFKLGFILAKAFIGILLIAIFGAGVWTGRLTKK